MATASFADITSLTWEPTTVYKTIQSTINQEVSQGLWANVNLPGDWCTLKISPTYGVNNSWVTITYQLISDTTQTATVAWPAGWPPPAEDINGVLPSHFFASVATPEAGKTSLAGTGIKESLNNASVAPVTPPTYKAAGACI